MTQRNPLTQTLLSFFIPFYILYWLWVTGKEVEQTYGEKSPSIWLLIAPFFIFIFATAMLFIGAFNPGSDGGAEAVIVTLLAFFLFIPTAILLNVIYNYKFGGMTEKVLGKSAERLLIFILLWFVQPAAVYIVQEKLNELRMQGATALTPQPPIPPQPMPQA